MITFFYGDTGTGKTETVTEQIGTALSRGESVILLCPEQEAVIAERRVTERYAGKVPLIRLEILNFTRLSERVAREYGGLTSKELGVGGRRLLMRRAVHDVQNSLTVYRNTAIDRGFIDLLLSSVSELKMFRVTASDLDSTAGALPEEQGALSAKLGDLAAVYTRYSELLSQEFEDPQDKLEALTGTLDRTGGAFFRGKTVFLDGFHGFTAQQEQILAHMFRIADNVTVSLAAAGRRSDRNPVSRKVTDTEHRLLKITERLNRDVTKVILDCNHRTGDPALLHLWGHLFRDTEPCEGEQGAVRILSSRTPYEEAEAVAQEIRRAVLGGARYRDITVLTRNVGRYEGILDSAFSLYGIPFYMSRRAAMVSKPLFRYLHALFAVSVRNFRRDDILDILKTGLTDYTVREISLFDNYVSRWNLTGDRITDGVPWEYHPKGFVEEFKDEDKEVLATVIHVRDTFCAGIGAFCMKLNEAGDSMTVRAVSALLWQFLSDAGMERMLAREAAGERERGSVSDAEQTEQLWQLLANVLDTLVELDGDSYVSATEYLRLFDLVTEDMDIGTIPSHMDEVVVGDAALLRPDRAKTVFLIGVNEGLFPLASSGNGFFSEGERTVLRESGLALSPDLYDRVQDELFHFRYAACAASEHLYISYCEADTQGKAVRPAQVIEQLHALFPQVKTENPADNPEEDSILTPAASFPLMAEGRIRGDTLSRALEDYYREHAAEHPEYGEWLAAAEEPIVQRANQLNEETARELFPGTVNVTQSRLEKYALCRFSYFCDYILQLEEQKRTEFSREHVGTFVHDILEHFMREYAREPEKFRDPQELDTFVDSCTCTFLEKKCHIRSFASQRTGHFIERMKLASQVAIRNLMHEFEQSSFRPVDFELPVGDRDGKETGNIIPAKRITLDDGTTAAVCGVIDRVDLMKEDGVTYVRVVDYKTGEKKFDLNHVRLGIDMQLLLYLDALQENGNVRYDGKLTPAGILYLMVSPKEKTYDTPPTPEVYERDAEKLTRSGLFLDNEKVLRAMDGELNGTYIPVKIRRDGVKTNAVSAERFRSIIQEMEHTVGSLVTEMKSGRADAVPLSRTHPEADKDPCSWCPLKPVCRASML